MQAKKEIEEKQQQELTAYVEKRMVEKVQKKYLANNLVVEKKQKIKVAGLWTKCQ